MHVSSLRHHKLKTIFIIRHEPHVNMTYFHVHSNYSSQFQIWLFTTLSNSMQFQLVLQYKAFHFISFIGLFNLIVKFWSYNINQKITWNTNSYVSYVLFSQIKINFGFCLDDSTSLLFKKNFTNYKLISLLVPKQYPGLLSNSVYVDISYNEKFSFHNTPCLFCRKLVPHAPQILMFKLKTNIFAKKDKLSFSRISIWEPA